MTLPAIPRRNRSLGIVRIMVAFTILIGLGLPQLAQAQTADTKARIASLKELVQEASKLFKDNQFDDAAAKIREAQASLIEIAAPRDRGTLKALQPIHTSIKRAHALLELEGVELEPLPGWNELAEGKVPIAPAKPMGISFTQDVAPWMVSMCGRCHVDGTRGNFSMASYEALMAGANSRKMVFEKDAKNSRLVEVIESGDMPRGGGKVTPEQLEKLTKWIDEGAVFDGTDPAASLRTYVKVDPNAPAPNQPPPVTLATGKESVTFSTDIAPILLENCTGCHINAMRLSGNFGMNTFTQLLRGGVSGPVIEMKKPDESLLIKKLRGMAGQRMPAGGRPALSEEQIAKISTWISEGATFDGGSADTNIEQVVLKSWANTATHEELQAKRRERAEKRWELVLPGTAPESVGDQDLLVLGDVGKDDLNRILKTAQSVMPQVRKALKLTGKDPLVKGGVVIFAFEKRYDYGEFGKMTEQRTLPSDWVNHWRSETIDSYAALAYSDNKNNKELEGQLTQSLVSLHLASLRDVPYWFAEGMGRFAAVSTLPKDDPRIAAWQQAIPMAANQVADPKTLLDGQLDEEQSALLGMRLVSVMAEAGKRKALDQLLKQLHNDVAFKDAFTACIGPPEAFVRLGLGIAPSGK